MKKLLSILVAISFMATGAYALNVKSVVNNFNTGSTADHEAVIMQVYNAEDTASLVNGDVVTWYLTNDDGRSVTKVNRLGQPVAGVIIETIEALTWGNMLVYGYHAAVKIAGVTSVVTEGYPLYAYGSSDTMGTANTAHANDGKACGGWNSACPAGDGTLATAYKRHTIPNPFGVALDTTTTATTVEAFINCL